MINVGHEVFSMELHNCPKICMVDPWVEERLSR